MQLLQSASQSVQPLSCIRLPETDGLQHARPPNPTSGPGPPPTPGVYSDLMFTESAMSSNFFTVGL